MDEDAKELGFLYLTDDDLDKLSKVYYRLTRPVPFVDCPHYGADKPAQTRVEVKRLSHNVLLGQCPDCGRAYYWIEEEEKATK